MPLINYRTDLKSLRYGGDQPGGGSSGQPYIVSPIQGEQGVAIFPQLPITDLFTNFYDTNKTTHDFPIRGGSIELNGATGRQTTPAGIIDRSRIQAFLNDPERGKIFLLKQAGLQLTNPKIQVPATLAGRLNAPREALLEVTRLYDITGRSTIEQVSAQGTGTHLIRHGLAPDYFGAGSIAYAATVQALNTSNLNRLVALTKLKLTDATITTAASIPVAAAYGLSLLPNEILNYQGGPDSTYGVGNTIVRRSVNTDTSKVYGSIAMSYQTLMEQKTTDGVSKSHPKLQDFREKINKQAGGKQLMTADYEQQNDWETRLKAGNPGASYDRTSYQNNNPAAQDQLNNLSPFYYDADSNAPWEAEDGIPSDMIKFVFECMSNDQPGDAVAIIFRSFLTGITDNHQAEFNSFKYLGRGETFRTYQGFDRSINFSFKIAAFTREEMKPLYTKLNHLISQIYPDYASTSKFMRGSVVKLTIGDYLYRVPGFLESVNITIDDNVAWEIALNDPGMRELPQVVSVQCTFKPIHDILPRREKQSDAYVPLIVNTPTEFLQATIHSTTITPPTQQPYIAPIATQAQTLSNNITAPTIPGLPDLQLPPSRRRTGTTVIPDTISTTFQGASYNGVFYPQGQ